MSFIIENGSIVAGAESYVSVVDADLYHSNRGNAPWALLTTAQKEEGLRRATDYITQVYSLKWKGYRVSLEQSLDWPRVNVERQGFDGYAYYDSDIIPNELKNASAEMAYKASQGELAPDLDKRTIREKVDVIEVEYADTGAEYVRYRAIDNMLAPLLEGGSSGTIRKVIR